MEKEEAYKKFLDKLKLAYPKLEVKRIHECYFHSKLKHEKEFLNMKKCTPIREKEHIQRLKISDSIVPGANQSLLMQWDKTENTKLIYQDLNAAYLRSF